MVCAYVGNCAFQGSRIFRLGRGGKATISAPLAARAAGSSVRTWLDQDRDASFNLHSHVVAVTEKKFLHLLDGIG
jgi:hypothetical protein